MVEIKKEDGLEFNEKPQLKEGYNAIYVPIYRRLSEDEALETIESFLNEIREQGGEIVGVMPVAVAVEPKHKWLVEYVPVERYVLIVKK